MTNDKNTTKLSELPNNTDNDTDLVNKILNQLDTSNDSIPPTFDLEQPPTENPVIKNQINKPHVSKSQLKPNISNPVVQKTVVEQRNPIYSSNNEQMPSPQGIQKVLILTILQRIKKKELHFVLEEQKNKRSDDYLSCIASPQGPCCKAVARG